MVVNQEIAKFIFHNITPKDINDKTSNMIIDYFDEEFITLKIYTDKGEADYNGYKEVKIPRTEEEWEINGNNVTNKKSKNFGMIMKSQDGNKFKHFSLFIKKDLIISVPLALSFGISQNIIPEIGIEGIRINLNALSY